MIRFDRLVSLKNKNTFRIGGIARAYAEPDGRTDLLDALKRATDENMPVFILGNGSNVLISDSGWNGVVLGLSAGCREVVWDNDLVRAQSGTLLNTLVCESIEQGRAGMELLSGIPGTLGGAVMMNAGAFDACIADVFIEADVLDMQSGAILKLSKGDMAFGYRASVLQNTNRIVLETVLRLNRGDCGKLAAIRHDILERRKLKQPLEYPNCGSVFKRPPGNFAGTLIETCGLKGLRCGDVEISKKHANFIVNRGDGTAGDVRKLIRIAQQKVFEHAGVVLEPEVIFVGEFDEPLFEPPRS